MARVLLKRNVLPGEFRKWRGYLDFRISDPTPGLSEPERRRIYRDWLVFRFERYYRTTRSLGDWSDFCSEAQHNPAFLFTCVGDVQVAQQLYSICWA